VSLRIHFSEISDKGQEYVVRDLSWFPERQCVRRSGPEAVVRLKRKEGGKVEVRGRLRVTVSLVCDRCLEPFDLPVSSEFAMLLEYRESGDWRPVAELELDARQLDLVSVREPVVDLGDLLRQEVLLALPHKRLCGRDCRGLCPHCGANRNRQECGCAATPLHSPFAVLARWRTH